jgi:hypothetical protein
MGRGVAEIVFVWRGVDGQSVQSWGSEAEPSQRTHNVKARGQPAYDPHGRKKEEKYYQIDKSSKGSDNRSHKRHG